MTSTMELDGGASDGGVEKETPQVFRLPSFNSASPISRVLTFWREVQVAQLIFGFLPRGDEGGRFFYCSSLDVKSCPRSERAYCIHSLPLILREFISGKSKGS